MRARIAAAFLTLVALPALAVDGFFRPALIPHEERPPLSNRPKDAALPCSLLVAYNSSVPAATTITYIYSDWLQCRDSFPIAIVAAAAAAKVSAGGEPANPPSYECFATVAFDPATAGLPTITYSGIPACSTTHQAALTAASHHLNCFFAAKSCP